MLVSPLWKGPFIVPVGPDKEGRGYLHSAKMLREGKEEVRNPLAG